MAKIKQPSADVGDTIEGDAFEKPAQPKKSRSSGATANPTELDKPPVQIFVVALTALVLSLVALVFAGFAVWQSNQNVAIESSDLETKFSKTSLSEIADTRLADLEAQLAASVNDRQKAIAALRQRIDQQGSARQKMTSVNVHESAGNYLTDNADEVQMAERIDQRFVTLERAVEELAAATTAKQTVANSNNSTGEIVDRQANLDLGTTINHASILIASGLLADNMAGAPLDRWIELLQGQVDKGVVIPDFAQLRSLANPTPERSISLLRAAHDLIPEMAGSLIRAHDDAGFMEKTVAKLGQLVRLREIGDRADGNEAALKEFETALATQDLDGAIRAANQWSGPVIPTLNNWVAAAQSRHSLDRAVNALVSDRIASVIAVQK